MPQDVESTARLGAALRASADVTFSVTVAAEVPADRVGPALRGVGEALREVGSDTPLPTGDLPTPSHVSPPAGRGHGPWTITVDFGFASGDVRARVPELIAEVLRAHGATPAVLDVLVPEY